MGGLQAGRTHSDRLCFFPRLPKKAFSQSTAYREKVEIECRTKLIKLLKSCESPPADIDSFSYKIYNLTIIPEKISVCYTQKPGRKNFL